MTDMLILNSNSRAYILDKTLGFIAADAAKAAPLSFVVGRLHDIPTFDID